MPFKSKAQRRKFAELLVKGEISEETFEEWNRETGSAHLPERVKKTAKKQSPSARQHPSVRQLPSVKSGVRDRTRASPTGRPRHSPRAPYRRPWIGPGRGGS